MPKTLPRGPVPDRAIVAAEVAASVTPAVKAGFHGAALFGTLAAAYLAFS